MADQPISSPEEPPRSARVWQRFPSPPGLLPRYAQQVSLGALALLMIVIMLLTAQPPAKPAQTSTPTPPAMEAQQTRIQEYQRRLQEQADRLAREQAELTLAKQALNQATPAPAADEWRSAPPATAPRDTVEDERQRREERARFADNVAFRRELQPVARTTSNVASAPPPSTPTSADTTPAAGQFRLTEGTIVETVLTNRLDGTFAGPVNCLVTTAVYARDGETLVIPAGARFLGTVRPVNQTDQTRLAVAFHRLTFPNGTSTKLDQFPGLNQVGDTALRDEVNRHYWQTFGASAAVGALAGLSTAQTRYGFDTTGADVYRQGMANSFATSSTRILERYLNQLPTVTIREGHPVIVYLTADLDLPAYRLTSSAAPDKEP